MGLMLLFARFEHLVRRLDVVLMSPRARGCFLAADRSSEWTTPQHQPSKRQLQPSKAAAWRNKHQREPNNHGHGPVKSQHQPD